MRCLSSHLFSTAVSNLHLYRLLQIMAPARKSPPFFRSAFLWALSVAAVLVPLQAQALDFRFLFNPSGFSVLLNPDGTFAAEYYEVEGLITGLNGDQIDQQPLRVEILRSRNDALAVGTYSFVEGSGFSVSAGQINAANWTGLLESQEYYRRLVFSDNAWWGTIWASLKDAPPAPPSPPLLPPEPVWIEGVGYTVPICACVSTGILDPTPGSEARFVPVSLGPEGLTPPFIDQTPGPLPVLGAAAAYGFSRRLRRRIRESVQPDVQL